MAGMFGAVLWLVSLFVEYSYGLLVRRGSLRREPAMFFVAQLCYLAVIVGPDAGQGRGRWVGWGGSRSALLFRLGGPGVCGADVRARLTLTPTVRSGGL